MEILALNKVDVNTAKELFCLGYKNYPFPVCERFESIYYEAIRCNVTYPLSLILKNHSVNVGILFAKGSEESIDIMALAVVPSARRLGVASMLLEEIKKSAQLNHFKFLNLEVLSINKAAFELYIKSGFYVTHKLFCFQGYLKSKRHQNLIINKCIQGFDQATIELTDCFLSNYYDCNFSHSYEVIEKDQLIGLFSLNQDQTELTRIQSLDCEISVLEKVIYAISYLNLFLKINNVPDNASELLNILNNSEMKMYCEQYRMQHELL